MTIPVEDWRLAMQHLEAIKDECRASVLLDSGESGNIEVDQSAEVTFLDSDGAKGAYVAAWIWVKLP